MSSVKDIPIFFIVCKGRSGSTLLQNILDAHLNTSVPQESTFLIHLGSKYKNTTQWNDKLIDRYISDLYRMRKIRIKWKLDREKLTQRLKAIVAENPNVDYGTISKVVYLSHPSIYEKSDIQIIGDKNLFHTFCIKELMAIYPNAKFIHLVRDPRANVRSHMISFKNNFVSFIAYKWSRYSKAIEAKKADHPERFLTIQYESIIHKPKETIQNVTSFLNIGYSDNLLDFHKIVREKKGQNPQFQSGLHSNLTQPITTEDHAKWKTFFTEKQQNTINFICRKYLEKYNYDHQVKSPSVFSRINIFFGKTYYHLWFFVVRSFFKAPFFIKKMAFGIIKLVYK
jgi:protein-tyrosine sulfotransferase